MERGNEVPVEKGKAVKPGRASQVVKFLVAAIVLVYMAQFAAIGFFDFPLHEYLALYNFKSEKFSVYQFVTYLFMHAGFMHLFLNMFILWMFGSALELIWNPKKFLFYFFFTGIGAGLLHLLISTVMINQLEAKATDYLANPSFENYEAFVEGEIGDMPPEFYESAGVAGKMVEFKKKWASNKGSENFRKTSENLVKQYLNFQVDMPSVGASGAVFGILLAFGMLFPNTLVFIYFLFPMKAKYFVLLLGALELYVGVFQNNNIANFAHLGGMLFGFLLLKTWGEKARPAIPNDQP